VSKILKNIVFNKKLLSISILLVVLVVTGSAYGLVQLTKTKPQTLVIAPVKVKTKVKRANAPVVQTPAQTETTPTTTPSTSTTPSSTQSDAITKCEAGESLTQNIEASDYNEGLSIRGDGISTINGYIDELPALEAAYNSDPIEGNLQNIDNVYTAIQNGITFSNNQISQENYQITQQQDISAGDLATNCPTLNLVTEHQLVPALPGYAEGSPWNP